MEESSGDTNSGECLHHFEVTGGGRACQSQSFKVNEKSGSRRRSRREEQARCNFGLAALTDRLTLRIGAPFYRCARANFTVCQTKHSGQFRNSAVFLISTTRPDLRIDD